MKKILLLAALVLTVSGSMAAGTMAQYVKTSQIITNVKLADFDFRTDTSVPGATRDATTGSITIPVTIAPNGSEFWATFTLSNGNAETNMVVTVVPTITGNVPPNMIINFWRPSTAFPGNFDGTTLFTGQAVIWPDGSKAIADFSANTPETRTYKIYGLWLNEDANEIAYAGQSFTITLDFTVTS